MVGTHGAGGSHLRYPCIPPFGAVFTGTCREAAHADIWRNVTNPVLLMLSPNVRYRTPRAIFLVVCMALLPTNVKEESAS